MKNNLKYYLIILILGLFFFIQNLNKPFYGHHDFNSVYYSIMARNYLKYGLAATKLGQVTNSGPVSQTEFNFQTHYPSTFPLLLAGSYKLFGYHEWAGRLVPLIFSLGILILLFKIARQLRFSPLASLATSIIAVTPMLRYFGKLPVHEPLVVFCSLLSVYFYLKYIREPSKYWLRVLCLSAFINAFISWPGYLLYPLLTLHAFIYYRQHWRSVAVVNLSLILSFGLHLIHTYLLTGDWFGGGLIKALIFRLNLSVTNGFTWGKYLIQEARILTVYYTRILLFSALIFCLSIFKNKKLSLASSIIVTLALFGLAYALIFSNMVFIHDYFNIFFLPFFSLSFAWLINQLQASLPKLVLPILILIFIFAATERLDFFQAHQNSNMHQTGYELGKIINQLVPEKEPAAVFSINYANHHEVFINYYADRIVYYFGYGTDGLEQFRELKTQPKHVFTVLTHRLEDGSIDAIFATQSMKITSFKEFNYYQLK
ncbi:MAG: glycosyltransferase family 39 protein [Candidatus Beckwithbacteria bacterium]